jgi:hypothetical protein|tara:strand:+ start:1853 stop:2785 length:933 start_codon:yes stop_codon:yes gene_type:complete
MTVRTPLYWNGDQMQEMKSTQLTEQYNLGIYYYSLQPSVALSVSGSGGNLTSIDDTRLQAGAASTASGSFPSEATTAEPSVVTTSYQRITQTLNSVTPTSDTGVTFPVYWNGTQVQAMTQADFLDTFVIPAINLMALGDITVSQGGTYHVSTSTTVTGSALVSSTPIFSDTRADTSLYSAGSIPESQDQPTTVTNYYLHKIEGDSGEPSVIATFLDSNNDMKQFSSASLGGLMAEYIQQQVVSSSTGYTLRYNVDGSGNTRGTAMVNTILTGGSGNYQQLFASGNDYRAQEFPDGSPSTANTYNFKILKA